MGENILDAAENDKFFMPRFTKNRIETSDGPVKILEISFGKFDESDITRLEDEYGRK